MQDEQLLGGLDLAATLQAGKTVSRRGVLAEADGGIGVLAMAERVSVATAARLAAVMDAGEVQLAREGVTSRHPCRIGIVALDEGIDDEVPAAALTDRLALWLDVSAIAPGVPARCVADRDRGDLPLPEAHDVQQARERLHAVAVSDEVWDALCAAAASMGIVSMRAPLLAARVARALAALAGRDQVEPDDAAFAARCVLGPRARVLPAPASESSEPAPPDEASEPPEPPEPQAAGPEPDTETSETSETPKTQPPPAPDEPAAGALAGQVLAAARAALPAHLLDRLAPPPAAGGSAGAAQGAGSVRASLRRGAPLGVRPGDLRSGARLDVLATLRAAAPWQRLRAASTPQAGPGREPQAGSRRELQAGLCRVAVRREDFRIKRFRQQCQTTVIFAVDASGSTALHRLAEAKGAVELLLADCYARRDSVAVLAFRGDSVDLLLPPSRSLVRAKRSLAGLPGGGGTPLAGAIDAASALAAGVRRRGDTPLAVLLTDGRANIARSGGGGREHAQADALQAARQFQALGISAMLLDTSPRPNPQAQGLAQAMGALYLPLPQADAKSVSVAVRHAKAALEQA
jgi:magnesium chelatase subunit D